MRGVQRRLYAEPNAYTHIWDDGVNFWHATMSKFDRVPVKGRDTKTRLHKEPEQPTKRWHQNNRRTFVAFATVHRPKILEHNNEDSDRQNQPVGLRAMHNKNTVQSSTTTGPAEDEDSRCDWHATEKAAETQHGKDAYETPNRRPRFQGSRASSSENQ